ncbi:chaperone modulator CbpM [Reinekea sp.]|jgi:chaperone modulatory protein CbpM|uniref:chaperone modulator CbpM n=1 Tax=Reinekea sp. TaxID=1970455 RepID=UPI003989B4AE
MTDNLNNITYHELCRTEGIEGEYIVAIVEYGIVTPNNRAAVEKWEFEASSVYWIKKASRLRLDFEIDWVAVSMVIKLLRQKDALEKENRRINRLLQRFVDEG